MKQQMNLDFDPLGDIRDGNIRLACRICCRDDVDHINADQLAILRGWSDICYDDTGETPPEEYGVWWTHIGLCPDCPPEV